MNARLDIITEAGRLPEWLQASVDKALKPKGNTVETRFKQAIPLSDGSYYIEWTSLKNEGKRVKPDG